VVTQSDRLDKKVVILGDKGGHPKCKKAVTQSDSSTSVNSPRTLQCQSVDFGDCPQCQKPLTSRRGRHGKFVGCTGYPDCGYTRAIDEPAGATPAEEARQKALRSHGVAGDGAQYVLAARAARAAAQGLEKTRGGK
jgi:hypothetical protein